MDKPTTFAIPIRDRWLIHAPLHEVTALVNAAGLAALRSGKPSDDEATAALQDALAEPPLHAPTTKSGPIDPKFLAVVTTRGCNIACAYCDFGGPTSERVHMAPELAVEAIDWMANRLVENGREEFFLHFFGGEPFLSGDLVEAIVHRTRAICAQRGLRPYFDASTNGVFNEARARWIGDYFDSIVLSFDGPPEFQNRNRPAAGGRGTFDAVAKTADRLSRSPVELCLRVCVTGESVSRMEEITRWMAERWRPSVINFEPLTENPLTANAGLSAADPCDFARCWMAAKRAADECGVTLVYSATEPGGPRLSSCPVGSDALIITPDSQVNGCYLQTNDWLRHGMNMSLGRIVPGGGLDLDANRVEHVRQLILDKPRCRDCFCQWSCAGGCHVSNTYRGCSEEYVAFCIQTRIITACLLLHEMGCGALADELLADRAALERLALQPWDELEPRTAARRAPVAA